MLQYRIGFFYSAATIAGAFSGLLAFVIEFMDGKRGLEAWSWIFVFTFLPAEFPLVKLLTQILEGIATVLVGILSLFGSCDSSLIKSFT